ncbi:zinc-ribbon domain containing protein [Telmatobacter sp. DSM 110680]|uniref:Zinc-ribbon domain containing protein n=1 Tax=Telmatobacter sp. DSM 110680 TaxID=3036704 RepID=A0AAU7DR46_9BACT
MCGQCGKTFVFSAAEQQIFSDKGFNNDPKRCKQCKVSRNARRAIVETQVKCFECGIETTVPFTPTGKRPVLCSGCFQKLKMASNSGTALVRPAK